MKIQSTIDFDSAASIGRDEPRQHSVGACNDDQRDQRQHHGGQMSRRAPDATKLPAWRNPSAHSKASAPLLRDELHQRSGAAWPAPMVALLNGSSRPAPNPAPALPR